MFQVILKNVFRMREKVAIDLGEEEEAEKPFLEHLEDLRVMMMRCITTLILALILCFLFHKELFNFIQIPVRNAGLGDKLKFQFVEAPEAFMMSLRLAFTAGIILSFPLLLFFILQFVLPGLRRAEKKILWPGLGIGFGLFLGGASFAFFGVLPRALQFFYEYGKEFGENVENIWRVGQYVKFSTQFVLIFGLSFELPVFIMALVKLGIMNYKMMSTTRAYAVVGIAIVSALVTPTQDVMTLLMLMGPLCFLYEICIWLARWLEKKEREKDPDLYVDSSDLEVKDDWDNDDYRPWEDITKEDEEDDFDPTPQSREIKPTIKPVAQEEYRSEPSSTEVSETPSDVTEPTSTPTEPPSSDVSLEDISQRDLSQNDLLKDLPEDPNSEEPKK